MDQEPKPTLGQRFGQGVSRMAGEIGAELKRLGTLGSYEMGAALQAFPPGESVYRGDLGLMSDQAMQAPGNLADLQAAAAYQPRIQPPESSERQSQSL